MDYFFVDPKDIHGRVALVRGEEFRHLSRVVRKKEGEHVMLVDGADTSYEAVIRLIDRIHAECEILDTQHRANEPRIDITLAVETENVDSDTNQRRRLIYSTSVIPRNHAITP